MFFFAAPQALFVMAVSVQLANGFSFTNPTNMMRQTSFVSPMLTDFLSIDTTTCTSRTETISGNRRSRLYNVPPSTDVSDIKSKSDRESPPQSFYQLQINCARAAELAILDGYKLIEVEFPPLPADVLELDDVSAYDVAQANLKLAIDFAKSFAAKQTSNGRESVESESADKSSSKPRVPKNIAILLPDEAELNIAMDTMEFQKEPYPNVSIRSLRESDPRDERFFKPEQTFMNLFGQKSGGIIRPIEGVDMYIIVVASAQELPDVEELSELDPNAVICFYNLKLDTLRGDLGAPAFPPKDFQDRFLSRVKPVYYLRTRQYSRSTPNPPYIVNYQGCLFRSYPGEFQTLLDTGNGKYRRVGGSNIRPALGEFKEQLTEALKVEGIIQDEGNVFNFLRTGYKTTTWWEDERENASDDWKS